jgi:flavin reductase (DIM6/NTAB) family NADH-FMN oxidoreductase RutF
MEPKLVGVAIERESVTARLVAAGNGFTVSLLARSDRDVVRRFVKPVQDVARAPDGAVSAMSGHPVTEVGADRRPVLAAAVGTLDCRLTRAEPLGSHTFCIGEVVEVSGEPTDVLRMEDTRMHYGG